MLLAWPRSLRVLSTPRQVFVEAARAQAGLVTLLAWLCVECLLLYPSSFLAAAFRILAAPAAVLQTVYGLLARYAIGPLFIMLAGAVLLHLLTRRRGVQYDIWPVACALGYTWVPHVLVVAVGTFLAGCNIHTPLLPPQPQPQDWLTWPRAALVYGPTAVWAGLAIRALNSTPPAAKPTAPRQAQVAWAALLLLALGTGGAAWDLRRNWAQVRPVGPGDPFPPLQLQGLDHADVDLALHRGHVLLVDFWATWCAPCVASMPHLAGLQQRFGAQGFEILAVNIEPENTAFVRTFMQTHALPFAVFMDADGSLQQRLHVSVYPTSFLIDASGVLRKIYYGPADPQELAAAVQALLVGQSF